MRRTEILIFALILGFSSIGLSEEIIFKSQSQRNFRAVRTMKKFEYVDQLGPRSVLLKDCNRPVIDKLWNKMIEKIKAIQTVQSSSKGSGKAKASLTLDGIKYSLMPFESSYIYFSRVPQRIHSTFIEIKRVCKNH